MRLQLNNIDIENMENIGKVCFFVPKNIGKVSFLALKSIGKVCKNT